MSDTPGADTLELERELRDGPPEVEMTADGWNTLFTAYEALTCRAADALAKQRLDLERCERMHLPAATAAAIQGHQQCMAAFDMSEKLRHAAETELASERAEKEELRRERDEAVLAFDKLSEPAFKSFKLENGEFSAALVGPVVERVAAAFVGQFKAMGGQNYIEMSLFDRDEPHQRYVVTVQKSGAKSPHELRAAAESLLAEAGKALEPFARMARKYGQMYLDKRMKEVEGTAFPHNYAQAVMAAAENTGWSDWESAIAAHDAVATRIASLTKEPAHAE